MGTFTVFLQVGDLGRRQFADIEALVDTGSSDTAIPAGTLESLGIKPVGRRPYRLADETVVEYLVGQALVRLEGQELIVLVVFMPENATALLGATSLETFGLGVDPKGKRLIPVPGLLKMRRRSVDPTKD